MRNTGLMLCAADAGRERVHLHARRICKNKQDAFSVMKIHFLWQASRFLEKIPTAYLTLQFLCTSCFIVHFCNFAYMILKAKFKNGVFSFRNKNIVIKGVSRLSLCIETRFVTVDSVFWTFKKLFENQKGYHK